MPVKAHWVLPAADTEQAVRLAQDLGVHLPLAQVLCRRGYRDAEAALQFLQPSLNDLYDPFLLRSMKAAVERLLDAIRNREEILLYGDYDVDGTMAVVLLKKAIELAGGRVCFHVPNRLKDGYGMRTEVIEAAAARGVRLVITLDTGIRSGDVVARARQLNVDVVVTDHHLPEAELPPAYAIVNPNQPGCPYPNKHLCGAGVALKLIQALFASLQWTAAKRERILASFIKLAAIATVADVVPLIGENRVIVKHGLAGLRTVRNFGLRALLDVAGLPEGDIPSAAQVAFRIAPRLNAAGRMASADGVIELFFTTDIVRARELAEQLHGLNQERQQTEAEIIHSILEECYKTPVTDEQAALVFSGAGWHRGVIGIVANRLVEKFHRPVFVLSEDPETGYARGSGRSIPALHLLEALESMADLFEEFGGHRQAAGVVISANRIEEFRQRLNGYAANWLKPEDLAGSIEIDALLGFEEITDKAVCELFTLAPFGCGNPPPVFAATSVEVASPPTVWKDKHLLVSLRQHGKILTCRAWNFIDRLQELEPGSCMDAAFVFEENPHQLRRGECGWNAVLKDIRRHEGAIKGKPQTHNPM